MNVLDKVLEDKSDNAMAFFWQMAGPVFVVCTFALSSSHIFLLGMALLSLFLCSRFAMTGFFYSLILWVFASAAEHFVSEPEHVWLLGIEGSYAMAFFITALSAERHSHFIQSLFSQLSARDASILHWEDELTKSQEASTSQQVAYQEKIASLQAQIEEVQSEQSSLQILNEVLRKTASREAVNSDFLRSEWLSAQTHLSSILEERNVLEKELAWLKNKDALVLENKRLIDEVHAIAFEREQTHKINETLAHLHRNESIKAQASLEQVAVLEREKEQLYLDLAALKKQSDELYAQIEKKALDSKALEASIFKLEEIQKEKDALQKQLEEVKSVRSEEARSSKEAEVDLSLYVEKAAVAHFEERIKELSQVESLFKQLKEQFAEKNQILHKTRSEFFHTETALEALKMDLSAKELESPVPETIVSDLVKLGEEVSDLQKENKELQDLVTLLSTSSSEPVRRKKKVKLNMNQETLF